MTQQNLTVNTLFADIIQSEVLEMENGEEYQIELMSPEGFLQGLSALGIEELSDTEIQCLMLILVKPELENAIIVADLQMVMENFNIFDEQNKLGEGDFEAPPSPPDQ